MPLDYSGTKKTVSRNIKTEMAHGKPEKQAVAIAMSVKRRGKPSKHSASLKHTMVK